MVEVKVDLEKCAGEGTCVDVCPVAVFELQDVKEGTKAIVVAEDDCLACMACEVQCPEQAIAITE